MGIIRKEEEDEGQALHQPLLPESSAPSNGNDDSPTNLVGCHEEIHQDKDMGRRIWVETKKLWSIVGPAIFSRVASYSMNIISQAFSGHIGEVELAAFSIANTVIVGFNFGLLVYLYCLTIFSPFDSVKLKIIFFSGLQSNHRKYQVYRFKLKKYIF